MKKYEPAITVVSLTLLFAVLAFLVTGAFIRQPEPKEGMVREKDDEMQIYNGRDWIDVFEQPKPAAFDEPNEPECDGLVYIDANGIIMDGNDTVVDDYPIAMDSETLEGYYYSAGVKEPKEYRCPVHGDLTGWGIITISTNDEERGRYCQACAYEHLAKYLNENLPGIVKIDPNEVKE